MKLDNLAGLCDETITAATPYIAALVAVLRRRRRPKDGGGQGNE
jgi:hypothetical protein